MAEYTVISEISAAKISDDADLEKVRHGGAGVFTHILHALPRVSQRVCGGLTGGGAEIPGR